MVGRTGLDPPTRRITLLSDDDLRLFAEGRHTRLYERLGSHPMDVGGSPGVYFATWAPEAARVSVMGDFNGWDQDAHPMHRIADSGIWECAIVGASPGDRYKYRIVSRHGMQAREKADPYGAWTERRPGNDSRVWAPYYRWGDDEWMEKRSSCLAHDAPVAIYEVHAGSWRRVSEEGNRPLTYRELAGTLPEYVADLGFSHVELMPLTEYPFGPSWGYQATGYFSPTSRYGEPENLMFLIDRLHRHGIGVILDWVPSHFATDDHGPAVFDGSHLYEHADPRQGIHPDWGSAIFNYGRNEVRSFLLSSALSWLDRYHVDGLRVDAVASMLYLDYSRADGEWVPNEEGGRENLAAVRFLRDLNTAVYGAFPGVQTFAEESTSWPGVTSPVHRRGLGFGYKWDMGWMHDTLSYLARDPVHRSHHHDELTFRSVYAGAERFVLPLSHDEVVHGKGSLLSRMWGDRWQSFANLRLLYAYMFTAPGKKLLFMGGEFAQPDEWRHDGSLDWRLLDDPMHRGVRTLVSDLATLYRSIPALHRGDHDADGFAWVGADDRTRSVVSYLRRDPVSGATVLVALNCTPVPRYGYRMSVPKGGYWRELINSDAREYGGTGVGNLGGLRTEAATDGTSGAILSLSLPPLGGLVLAGPEA